MCDTAFRNDNHARFRRFGNARIIECLKIIELGRKEPLCDLFCQRRNEQDLFIPRDLCIPVGLMPTHHKMGPNAVDDALRTQTQGKPFFKGFPAKTFFAGSDQNNSSAFRVTRSA